MSENPVWLGVQQKDYNCGPASLAYALTVLGYSPREPELRRIAKATWSKGTASKNLVATARKTYRLGVEERTFHDKDKAWSWLESSLARGAVFVIDVDDQSHYVALVDLLDGERVVLIDPSGFDDGDHDDDYAAVNIVPKGKLLARMACDAVYSGIRLQVTGDSRPPRGPRLHFSREAIKRYQNGSEWLLDEYLVDVGEIGARAAEVTATPKSVPLADMLRGAVGALALERATYWYGAHGSEVAIAKAHLADMAFAASTMGSTVPVGSDASVVADVASILSVMLMSED